MKIKNLNIRKKAVAMALAGTLTTATLIGCGNMDMWDTQYTFNKAVIINGNIATIVEISKWTDYDGEQLQVTTQDGMVFLTSSIDTKLFDDRNSYMTVEDYAKSFVGEDGEINYLSQNMKNKR